MRLQNNLFTIMPRQARQQSSTGVYHVMIRGINRERIFHDQIDFLKMEKILKMVTTDKVTDDTPIPAGCAIYAYCLMPNHLHILIQEKGEAIDRTMKRIGVSYASYFNKRYERSGPLFEGRFRSEPVSDPGYFIKLLHYIHLNPVKAGIVQKPGDYKWSSWNEYNLDDDKADFGICELHPPFSYMTRNELRNIVLTAEAEADTMITVRSNKRMKDDDALQHLRHILGKGITPEELISCPKEAQIAIVDAALEAGIGLRQLSRLTGIGYMKLSRMKSS